jgi:hypothetical protein
LIDKKPDDQSSAEVEQQPSQQLCVLDTKPAGAESQVKEDNNEFDSVVPEVDQDKVCNATLMLVR